MSLRETDDRHSQIDRISQLVRESLYAVDESIVAEAILARACIRHHVAQVTFATTRGRLSATDNVRSFRPTRRARSFHLTERRPTALHA